MARPLPRPLFVALSALVAGGCLGPSDYPSLSPRPIEDLSLAEPAAPRAAPATAPEVASARYAPLIAKARDGDTAFRRALAEARPTLDAGHAAAVGSDAWSAAQQTLSRLQGFRTPVVEAVSAMQAASEDPDTHADSGLEAATAAALKAVQAIDASEAAALLAIAPRRS